ncbi:nitrilase-related carbon-nitrogen hydrolase [Stygiobacter electus]|uniref:CN hydrolase domain-containing protein n=1 Tax=Stygiobacter electus TaxID=3032292 RepID=A0AAE3P216_9BACT|nr:nitrilase-related carbon-nitrogen hydrolase [Stygiobacter electus]MDF1612904.1 hypothetical protein [Stygiobacter electus]
MKIGICQYSPAWENPHASIEKINFLMKDYENVDLLIFPEMTLTGFTMKSKILAEEIDGISFQFFMNIAQKLKTNIFFGVIEKDDDKIYNSLIHVDQNGLIIARYRKIHPFSLADEDKNYSAGNEFIITKINQVKFALSICYDLRFPELYRFYAKKGIDVIINIANWPVKRIEHYTTLLKARAIENQCFAIGVNRIGKDGNGFEHTGASSVYNPLGKEIFSAENKEGIFVTEIDINEVDKTRKDLPFLNDMKLV